MTSLDTRSEHVLSSCNALFHTPPSSRVRVVRRIASCSAQIRKKASGDGGGGRTVAFSNEVKTYDVSRRSDLDDEDFQILWYCKDDFKFMKREYTSIVKKMAKGLPLTEDEEPRGLEHKTPIGNKKRHKNRLVSIDAVLREQDRQWERNRLDSEFVAELYIQASAHCRLQASIVAKNDEEYVNKVVRQLSSISEVDDDEDETHEEPVSDSESFSEEKVTISHGQETQGTTYQVDRIKTHHILSAAA